MEGIQQHRRSKSASDFEGLPRIQKLRTVRLSPDSGSHINACIRNDSPVEIRQSSFGRAPERPSTNLLAERIHKETQPKRRSLSSIARLIRSQGLPSLWNAHKHKKRLLDSYRLNKTSTDTTQNREVYDGQTNWRSPKKQESEDAHEDLETSSFVNGRYSSRWSASSMLSKSEMALIQQNLDSKRFTYDETINEKLWDSEHLDGTLDMLGSRDLMSHFGRRKNSFGSSVYDKQGSSSSSLGSPTALLNPPSSAKHSNAKSRRSDKDIDKHSTYHPNSNDGLVVDPQQRLRARIAHKLSDIQLEEKSKKNTPPTPILVLAPNFGDKQNNHSASTYQSQGHLPNSAKMTTSVGSAKELSWRKTKSYYDAEFLEPGEARKLAQKTTRQVRDACDESEIAGHSGLGGCGVNESSYGANKSDMEIFKRSSKSSYVDDNQRGSHPSSKSLNEEAKKRLVERWKITNIYRDLEIVGDISTLGEMLSKPDREKRSKQNGHRHIDRSITQVGSDNGSSTINKGGSENRTERTSRSISLPPIGGEIHGSGTRHDMLANEKHLFHNEPISHGTCKMTKQYPSHKDHFSSQSSMFRGKKPLPCPPNFTEEMASSLEARFEIQMEANVKELPYQQLTFQMGEQDECCGNDDVAEIVAADAEHGIITLLSKTSLSHPNHSSEYNESSSSTAHDQKDSCHQELCKELSEEVASSSNSLGAESVTLESSKDADYASPISVLESPFVEDASSSSQSSERVDAELNDLRMQLHLLKMEFTAFENTSAITAKGWEASYTVDVLIHAGLQEFGFDLFRIMWHSPNCPLDSRLFDILEEKYKEVGSRPERMMLFDRINSALSEIFLKHVDVRPWAMPKLVASMHPTWQKEWARRNVENVIGRESANAMRVTERILDREMQWPEFAEEIVFTGNEIQRLLIDDLINEFLFDEWC